MPKIGDKLLTIEATRKIHNASIQALTIEQLQVLLRDSWGDVPLVAELLGYKRITVQKWIERGTIKAEKGPSGRWWIPLWQFKYLFDLENMDKYSIKGRLTPKRMLVGRPTGGRTNRP
jgi:hypothetical protein